MPTEPEAFLEPPGVSRLQPCTWTHLKKALYHTRPVGGTIDKYLIHLGQSKVLQYFGNVWHNSVYPDMFVEIMKAMNYNGLKGAKLTRFSPNDTCRIWLCGLKHGFGIHHFSATWSCLIVEILPIQTKFFNHLVSVLWLTAPFLFAQHMFLVASTVWTRKAWIPENDYVARSFVWLSNHTWSRTTHNVSAHQRYHYTTNHSGYQPRLELLQSCDIHIKY